MEPHYLVHTVYATVARRRLKMFGLLRRVQNDVPELN